MAHELTVRPYRGMLRYFNQASQLTMEVRFTNKPAKICVKDTHLYIILSLFYMWAGLIKQHICITIMKTQAMVMKMLAMATTVWSAEMARAIDVAV